MPKYSMLAVAVFVSSVFLPADSYSIHYLYLQAQSASSSVQEPEYVNQFFRLGTDGKLIPLEQVKMTHEMKTHNHFISNSAESAQTVPNTASPVRVSSDSHFIVKAGFGAVDPATVIALKPLIVEKNERALPTHSAKASIVPFSGMKSQAAPDNSVLISIKKYGAGSYEIVPQQPLPAGEYVLTSSGGAYGQVSCFGVDAGTK